MGYALYSFPSWGPRGSRKAYRSLSVEEGVAGGGDIRCSVCGSPNVAAKIEGKYYCYECGAKLLRENSRKMLELLKRKYLEQVG